MSADSVRPAVAVTPELVELVLGHKPTLLKWLAQWPTCPAPWRPCNDGKAARIPKSGKRTDP